MSVIIAPESDYSGSDDDMVFADEFDKSKSRNRDFEFRPIPKEAITSTTFKQLAHNRATHNDSNKSERNGKYKSSRRQEVNHSSGKLNNRIVCQQSQPLDDLRYAVMEGNLPTTKDILAKGIMVDAILKAGWTALMYAASCARHEIVLHLLENKADPNYHKDMFTPLMAACASTKDDIDLHKCCCHLLQYGARANVHERHLTTPLMFASRQGHFQIVKELIEAGAELNAQDNRNQTALFLAASVGHGQIVHLLLSKGADPHLVDYAGQTSIDIANSQGYIEIAAVLERNAAKKLQDCPVEENVTPDIQQPILTRETKDLIRSIQSAPALRQNRKYFDRHGELEVFLNGLELSDVVKLFNEHQLSFTDLLVMDEEELEKIGVSQLGIRKKILEAVKNTHKKQWKNSSLQNLRQQQYISCPDAVAMMANISKHLKYISTTVTYIRNQIQLQPRILELAQDTANVHDLIDELDGNIKNISDLNDEIRFLKLHLNKVQDNVKYIPADLIVETVTENKTSKRTLIFWSAIFTATIGGIIWKKQRTITYLSSLILSKLSF